MRRLTLSLVFIVALVLSACAAPKSVSPLDKARNEHQARHVAEQFDPTPVVIDDPYGWQTSELFFQQSETVVVADTSSEAQLRAASVAVTAHSPLVVYDPEMHSQVVSEIQRLGAHTVLTVGDVALAPSQGGITVLRDPGGFDALGTMTSLRFNIRDVAPEDGAAAIAELDGWTPTWLRTLKAPATKPGARAEPFPLQSRRDADMSPVVVATAESSLPAITNARSFGARVGMLDEPDPRRSEATLLALAGLSDHPLIALGDQFGSSAELSHRITQAEQQHQHR